MRENNWKTNGFLDGYRRQAKFVYNTLFDSIIAMYNTLFDRQRYGTYSQGISRFYLHTHTFIRSRDPGGMEG